MAHHGENRQKGLFAPNKGMLYKWCEENLKLYDTGCLKPVTINLDDGSKDFITNVENVDRKKLSVTFICVKT